MSWDNTWVLKTNIFASFEKGNISKEYAEKINQRCDFEAYLWWRLTSLSDVKLDRIVNYISKDN
jgi:hypothetical protein